MGQQRHPPQLIILFLTEMWERFSFYLMLGILPLYLSDSQKGGMGWSDETSTVISGTYAGLVYFTPFIGGLIADRLLGARKTILIGAVLMMIGHIVLAVPNQVGLFLGLTFLILGNGAFKPNISTLVGNLYPPGSPLKDAGYNIFYLGINIGAFICNFVAAIVRNIFDASPLHIGSWEIAGWHAAFATAGVGMFIGLVIFSLNYRRLAHADVDPRAPTTERASLTPLWVQCLLPAAALGAAAWVLADPDSVGLPFGALIPLKAPTAAFLGACIPVIIFYLNVWRGVRDAEDRGRTAALLVVFGVVVVFWTIFTLNLSALTFWARDNTDRQPNALVRVITDRFEDFAENAPPDYYVNAGPETPRPSRETFEIVSEERYKQLEEAKQLSVVEGRKVYATQRLVDQVYARATPETQVLPPGQHLRLTNTELFQSINPGFIVLLTPLIVALWAQLRQRNLEPSTPAKIGLGLLVTAGSPLIMLIATAVAHDGAMKVSAWWLFGTYFMISVGELCLSPMGLSLVSKMSPPHIQAFMMGGWFLATSFGNKLSGIFGEAYQSWDHYLFWSVLIASAAGFGLFILALLPWLKRQMATESARPAAGGKPSGP
jgi:POT family proton-dependent oligopeptide transporter